MAKMRKRWLPSRKSLKKGWRCFASGQAAVEAYRLEQRTRYDLEMLRNGLRARALKLFPSLGLAVCREHLLLPCFDFFLQGLLADEIDEWPCYHSPDRAMYNGDRSRKETLVE